MYKIIRLEDSNNEIFNTICTWYEDWLGKQNNESKEEIIDTFQHSINTKGLPQTYICMKNKKAVGMFQIAMCDDLNCRPNLYPWFINFYVDKAYRKQGVASYMLSTLPNIMKDLNIETIYLYTTHIDFYEKFNFELLEELYAYKLKYQKIYKLTI